MAELVDVVVRGLAGARRLDEPAQLAEAARAVAAFCGAYPGWRLEAASPLAERLIGAALMLDASLNAEPGADTIVLDVGIASGTLMARASQRARGHGAATVVGVALYATVPPPSASQCNLDSLFLLEVLGEASGRAADAQQITSALMHAG